MLVSAKRGIEDTERLTDYGCLCCFFDTFLQKYVDALRDARYCVSTDTVIGFVTGLVYLVFLKMYYGPTLFVNFRGFSS